MYDRMAHHCSICGSPSHNRQHHGEALTRSEEAGRLVYEDDDLSFAEAARRVGVTRQAVYKGWRRYVRRRDLHRQEICKTG